MDEEQEVIFKPNPGPQTTFLAAPEQEVLYGGAAGGGKSYGILADPLRDLSHPSFRGLILRRTTEELRELVQKSQEFYPKAIPGMKWSERKMEWKSPAGGTLWMSYLDRDQDVTRYQGQAYNYIAFDELTQWPTPYAWNYMRSRLRSTVPDLRLYMRACVDEGEVLTSGGWKDIKEVSENELVYSLNSRGTLELKKVTGFHKYRVKEPLARIRKKNLYVSMTPDHRVFYKRQGSNVRELIRFNEHVGKSLNLVRTSMDYRSEGFKTNLLNFDGDSYAEFIGLYIAEGSVNQTVLNGNYKVVITQNKEVNHPFVRRVMEASGCKVSYSKNGDFQITNKVLREHLLPLGKSHEKHFPREFLATANKHQLKLAFNAYALGDGHWQSDKSVSLFTCSDQLADDLQEICIKLGYKTMRTYQALGNEHHNRWVIYVSLRGDTTRVDKGDLRNDVAYEDYEGFVYCLSVEDNENFILRQKGYVWVSGNTSNPGGPGHAWVKKMFIDPAPWGEAFWATDPDTGEIMVWPSTSQFARENDLVGQPMFKRRFIPAKLSDNPYLYESGQYEVNLLSLPEIERRKLLEGDWDIAEGAAFTEFNRDAHVIEPFDIPTSWRKFRACDYGYSSYSAVLWFAVTPEEQLIVYRELYVSKVLAEDLARMVLELEADDGVISYGVLDSSCWHQRGDRGPSIAESMNSYGCRWRPSDRSRGARVAGKNQVHKRLQVDEYTGEPGILFFNTCVNTISQLPIIPLDKTNPEDVDTKSEDHIYDALRYGVMTRPRSTIWDYHATSMAKEYKPFDRVFGY